jgi:hypothetical protein
MDIFKKLDLFTFHARNYFKWEEGVRLDSFACWLPEFYKPLMHLVDMAKTLYVNLII